MDQPQTQLLDWLGLGCKVGFIGKVANDREGQMQLTASKLKEWTRVASLRQPKAGAARFWDSWTEKAQELSTFNSGVNDLVELREIQYEYISQTKLIHLSSFVGEKSFRAQKKLLSALPEGVEISFDPGSLYAQKGLQ